MPDFLDAPRENINKDHTKKAFMFRKPIDTLVKDING